MVPVLSLWLPILLSALAVFLLSSLIHMLLPWHRGDFAGLPQEDRARDALRGVPTGGYIVPWHGGSPEGMKDPAWQAKRSEGPVAFVTVLEPGPPSMGKQLGLWFLYTVLVGIFAAYVAGRALGPAAPYGEVFRFVGTTAFAGYSLAIMQQSIWWGQKWSMTLKTMIDGLLYALVTAGFFGWLWPA